MPAVFIVNPNRPNVCSKARRASTEVFGEMEPSWVTVKALLVQHGTTLWIGTRAGHILLVELSSRQLLQAVSLHCHSVRGMASVLIGRLLNNSFSVLLLLFLNITCAILKKSYVHNIHTDIGLTSKHGFC